MSDPAPRVLTVPTCAPGLVARICVDVTSTNVGTVSATIESGDWPHSTRVALLVCHHIGDLWLGDSFSKTMLWIGHAAIDLDADAANQVRNFFHALPGDLQYLLADRTAAAPGQVAV